MASLGDQDDHYKPDLIERSERWAMDVLFSDGFAIAVMLAFGIGAAVLFALVLTS